MDGVELCGRCARAIHDPDGPELCWWCEGPMCSDCWESFGVCGCPGSDEAQADLKRAATPAEQAAIIAKAGPIGATHQRRRKH
jgi:hypothetical protein